MKKAGVERESIVAVGDEMSTECIVEGLGGPVQAVDTLLKGPHMFVSLCIVHSETLGELEVDGLSYLRVEKGSENVEAIHNHALLGGEG